MERLELDFADTAAANADDGGDILLDLVLLELGVVVDFDLPADGLVPVCLVIGGLPLLLLGLLALLFSFFEVEEEEDAPAAIAAGLDPPPPPPLSLPFSFALSLLDAVVVEPLTRGVEGILKEDTEEWEFLSRVCVCVRVCVYVLRPPSHSLSKRHSRHKQGSSHKMLIQHIS